MRGHEGKTDIGRGVLPQTPLGKDLGVKGICNLEVPVSLLSQCQS